MIVHTLSLHDSLPCLRAIGGLNALRYVDLSRRDLTGRTAKPIVSVRMGFSNLSLDSRRIAPVATTRPPVSPDLDATIGTRISPNVARLSVLPLMCCVE